MDHPGALRSGEKRLAPVFGPGELRTNGDTLYHAIKDVRQYHTDQDHHGGSTPPFRTVRRCVSTRWKATPRRQWHLQDRQCHEVDTFELFDAVTGTTPIAPNGSYTGGGRWSYPLHPYIDSGADLKKVFYRVTGDDALGTFQGTLVSVNGVDR